MANGLGEYFSDMPAAQPAPAPMAGPQLPVAHPTRTSVRQPPSSLPQVSGVGEYFGQSAAAGMRGMGAWSMPIGAPRRPGAFRKIASKVSPLAGSLGDVSDVVADTKSGAVTGLAAASSVTSSILSLGLLFGTGWLVGKALAPNRADEKAYTWAGAVGTVLFGPIALGIEALVADHMKK